MMKPLALALALLLTGCTLSNDIGFLLTGRTEDISWRHARNAFPGPSSPTPAPTWCQGSRDTWNGFGCSMR